MDNEENEVIDLTEILSAVRQHLLELIFVTLAAALVGFPPKTADVRMAQYESGSRTPKEDLVKAIANVLEVSPLALQIPDIDSDLGFIHTLFAIEDIHGIRAEKQGDAVHLIFDGSKRTMDESIFTMLSAWAEQSEKLRCGKISKEQYDHWRYTFPEEDTTQPPATIEFE